MARYIVAGQGGAASGFRPWSQRLLGDYQRAGIVIPTQSQKDLPSAGAVTGGLGLDLSTVPPWAWLAAAAGAAWWFFGRRR